MVSWIIQTAGWEGATNSARGCTALGKPAPGATWRKQELRDLARPPVGTLRHSEAEAVGDGSIVCTRSDLQPGYTFHFMTLPDSQARGTNHPQRFRVNVQRNLYLCAHSNKSPNDPLMRPRRRALCGPGSTSNIHNLVPSPHGSPPRRPTAPTSPPSPEGASPCRLSNVRKVYPARAATLRVPQ